MLDATGATLAVGSARRRRRRQRRGGLADPFETINRGAIDSGAIHVYQRTGATSWQRQAFIKARQSAPADSVGRRLALSQDGKVLMASAQGRAVNATGVNRNNAARPPVVDTAFSNAAYFFEARDDGSWDERATVMPPTSGASDVVFALSGDGRTYALGSDAAERVGDIVPRTRVRVLTRRPAPTGLLVPLAASSDRSLGLPPADQGADEGRRPQSDLPSGRQVVAADCSRRSAQRHARRPTEPAR